MVKPDIRDMSGENDVNSVDTNLPIHNDIIINRVKKI